MCQVQEASLLPEKPTNFVEAGTTAILFQDFSRVQINRARTFKDCWMNLMVTRIKYCWPAKLSARMPS